MTEDRLPLSRPMAKAGDGNFLCGLAKAVMQLLIKMAGRTPPSALAPSSKPPTELYLSLAERDELAILRAQGFGVRQIGRLLAVGIDDLMGDAA